MNIKCKFLIVLIIIVLLFFNINSYANFNDTLAPTTLMNLVYNTEEYNSGNYYLMYFKFYSNYVFYFIEKTSDLQCYYSSDNSRTSKYGVNNESKRITFNQTVHIVVYKSSGDSSISKTYDVTDTYFLLNPDDTSYTNISVYKDNTFSDFYFEYVTSGNISDKVPIYDLSSTGSLSWLSGHLSTLNKVVSESQKNYVEKSNSILDKLGSLLDYINPSSDKFFLKSLLDILLHFIDAVIGFIDGLFNFLWNLLVKLFEFLFVPDEERFTAISDTVSSKFEFVEVVKTSISSLGNTLQNIENNPSLSINIDSKYYTGTLKAIDMGWYSQFKGQIDLVITGFCYLLFLWRLYSNLPNIINGFSSGFTVIDSLRGVDKN